MSEKVTETELIDRVVEVLKSIGFEEFLVCVNTLLGTTYKDEDVIRDE